MDPFIAEIRIVGFNFAPKGWAFCDGQLLPISQNTALFSLLGTFYGGNGASTFALPNLQGATPLGSGQGPGLSPRTLGETGGSSTVDLLESEMPSHSHALQAHAGDPGDLNDPTSGLFALAAGGSPYNPSAPAPVALGEGVLSFVGQSSPHNNMQPYLTLNFVIALQGVYPSRP